MDYSKILELYQGKLDKVAAAIKLIDENSILLKEYGIELSFTKIN